MRQNRRVADPFTWRDGERLIRFGDGALAEASALLAEHGFDGYALLTTERALPAASALAEAASAVVHVPSGKVDELAAVLLDDIDERPLVALGGGRVVDTGKALAGARGSRVAAVPTTLSGAPLTPFHRLPKGVDGARLVRPALVVADPAMMASPPPSQLAASAMNALAHAFESLYTPLANPVCELAALRAAALIAHGLEDDDRPALALAAILAGYAVGCTGIAGHHAICQTIVRTAGAPHAQTNAVMLPHSVRMIASRAPAAVAAFGAALEAGGSWDAGAAAAGSAGGSTSAGGRPSSPLAAETSTEAAANDPEAASGDAARLAALCGHTRLGSLGVREQHIEPIAAAAARHPALHNTPDPPSEHEIAALVRDAL